MPDTPAFLSNRLESEGEKAIAFFASLSDEQWQTEVYTEGGIWTIRSILAHFVTAERGFLKLFKGILGGGIGASEDFSIDRYNARQQEKTKDMSHGELLEQFKIIRSEMIAWVKALDDKDLDIEGRHPFLGQSMLVDMIKMVYRHNQIHFRDLRKLV